MQPDTSNCEQTIVSRRAASKVTKHGLAVYPLEAYGFLIGARSPHVIRVALPVAKTAHWYDTSDRFALVDRARPVAADYATSVSLELVGVYHTESGGHPDFPDSMSAPCVQAPGSLADLLLLVAPMHGGESMWGHCVYDFDARKGWLRVPHRHASLRVEGPGRNPRRLLAGWRDVWGPADYSNDHEREIPRVFGEPCRCRRCQALPVPPDSA